MRRQKNHPFAGPRVPGTPPRKHLSPTERLARATHADRLAADRSAHQAARAGTHGPASAGRHIDPSTYTPPASSKRGS